MSETPMSAVAVEQERYAQVLAWGTRIGFGLLVAGFLAYTLGLVHPHVPVDRLPELWSLSAAEFLRETELRTGWSWIDVAHRGDMMNLAGIVVLAGCSIASLLAVVPIFHARGDRVYVAICVLEVAVILLAASGFLVTKH